MRVTLLDTGRMTIDRSQVLWNVDCGTKLWFPIYAVLVEHPDGLFLFDTGVDPDHVRAAFPWERIEQTPEQRLEAQLRSAGASPDDVTHLVNSHLHFDHVGANRLLRGARTFVAEAELRAARAPQPFEALAYSDRSFEEASAFELLEGDVELAHGLRLYATPGHCAGHYSLLVDGDAEHRSMLFTFDAAYSLENLEREIISGFHLDPIAATESIRRLKALAAEHDAELFVAHDLPAFAGYRRAPDAYELSGVPA